MTHQSVSLLDGGRAPIPECATLGEALERAAADTGAEGLCFIDADGSELRRTYGELLDEAGRLLAGIRAAGTRPEELVVLQIDRAPDLCATFWACVLGGFVPVLVPAGSSDADRAGAPDLLHRVWSRYGKPRVITGHGQPIAWQTLRDPAWAGAYLGEPERLCARTPDRDRHTARPDELAALLLTSGSTGMPKAVRLTHHNILSRCAATAAANKLSDVTRTFNWMPLDHAGGLLLFHVRDVFLRAYQVHAPLAWVLEDPLRWLAAVDRHRACTTWAPNFAFGLINDQASRLAGQDWDLSCLRYIMNGGEAVRGGVVRRFLELLAPFDLAQDSMFPGWGMSETAAGVVDCQLSALVSGDERYVPAGRPQPGTAVRVVDGQGAVVPVGTTGHLQVRGATVTAGYYDEPEQNSRSFTPDGWFRTGDLAYVKDGVLTVTGRADDLIECGGVTCHGHEIEAVVEELGCVTPSYTVSCQISVDGHDELAVFFHPRRGTPPQEAEAAVRAHVADRLGVHVQRVVPLSKDDIPKTGIGKLRRSRLRQWFETDRLAVRTVRTGRRTA
ncbi:AMP-binding protein [Streptomyces sp. NPDC051956]|uniref:AMP-binding protein n=1 Tax=Streptomyces sp. NPDC051956 TaxID=3365677 RepID=UPI0037D43886